MYFCKSKLILMKTNSIDRFYNNRKDFTIVALTGLTGVGCTYLANMMSEKDFISNKAYNIRNPKSLLFQDVKKGDDSTQVIKDLVFKRKYTICYDFISKNHEPFVVIKYTYVIWLYVFLYLVDRIKSDNSIKDKKERLKNAVKELVVDKFSPSHKDDYDVEYKKLINDRKEKGENTYHKGVELLNKYSHWDELFELFSELDYSNYLNLRNDRDLDVKKIADVFIDKEKPFCKFCQFFNSEFSKLDYYCFCFFYHRLGSIIRNVGNPTIKSTESYGKLGEDDSHLYDLIGLINQIIKGIRKNCTESSHNKICRVVIDSLRNSFEALFLKERYSAFYFVAVQDDMRQEHLRQKISKIFSPDLSEQEKNKRYLDAVFERIEDLCQIETSSKHYEQGKFASPNLEQCISNAEIHLLNQENDNSKHADFYSLEEQWIKYASLILHPGLITPSSEERCMAVAYTAKFNSGCLSRQVGAVITNKYHTIRSIGWNEVPYGQIPCSLRELPDLVKPNSNHKQYIPLMYSEFERSDIKSYVNNKNLRQEIINDYPHIDNITKDLDGLPFSYCFKTLHNRYIGDKNQVYTRSLHAEENAIMQMAKYGGEALMDGIIYVTASPCELCSKKLYQIGVKRIVYIDSYPGIARQQIIKNGCKSPELKLFQGAYGGTYFKLFQPFIAYKDELTIRIKETPHKYKSSDELLKKILQSKGLEYKKNYTPEEFDKIVSQINLHNDET